MLKRRIKIMSSLLDFKQSFITIDKFRLSKEPLMRALYTSEAWANGAGKFDRVDFYI